MDMRRTLISVLLLDVVHLLHRPIKFGPVVNFSHFTMTAKRNHANKRRKKKEEEEEEEEEACCNFHLIRQGF